MNRRQLLKADKEENHFLNYNYGVILETDLSHNYKKEPTLKSKLLFMNYRFNKYTPSTFYCTESNIENSRDSDTQKPIIKFGREGFMVIRITTSENLKF